MSQKPFWITAREIMKMLGYDYTQMAMLRKNNPDVWKRNDRGGIVYDLTKFPESLKKNR